MFDLGYDDWGLWVIDLVAYLSADILRIVIVMYFNDRLTSSRILKLIGWVSGIFFYIYNTWLNTYLTLLYLSLIASASFSVCMNAFNRFLASVLAYKSRLIK